MAGTRKQRGDSRLKTLQADLQAEIFRRCEAGKYPEVVKWLRSEWDIRTSDGALSDFYSWYRLRQRFSKAESHVQQFAEMVRQSGLAVDASRMKEAMNAMFLATASDSGDFESFVEAYKLMLKGEQIEMEKRRIALLEQKAKQADEAKKVIESKLSPEEERKKLREILK